MRFRTFCGPGRAPPGVNDWITAWSTAAHADISFPWGQCGGAQAQLAARASIEQYLPLASLIFMEFDATDLPLIRRAR